MMGRILGPSFYGELSALISFIGLLAIVPISLSLVIVKYVSSAKSKRETEGLIKWLRSNGFKASIIISIIIVMISPAVTTFLRINKSSYIILIALLFLFSIQTVINRSILQGLLKFKESVLTVLAEASIKLIISLMLIYMGFRVGGAIFAITISSFLGWYMTNMYLKGKFETQSNFSPEIKKMFIFSIPVLLQSFAITSIYSADVILVKHFFSSHEAGIYASLSTLGKVIFFGAAPIGAVMFPLISKRQSRGQTYKKIFMYSLFGTLILAFGVLLIYWLIPDLAIGLLYGSAYLEASDLLIWFGIFITLFTLSSLIINYCLSLGKTQIVILPMIAAVSQIAVIWFYHQTLFQVVIISVVVSTLLLVSLLIYSIYEKPK